MTTATFALVAWPDGGTAEMLVDSFPTREAAQAARAAKEARYPRWRFRVAEMTTEGC